MTVCCRMCALAVQKSNIPDKPAFSEFSPRKPAAVCALNTSCHGTTRPGGESPAAYATLTAGQTRSTSDATTYRRHCAARRTERSLPRGKHAYVLGVFPRLTRPHIRSGVYIVYRARWYLCEVCDEYRRNGYWLIRGPRVDGTVGVRWIHSGFHRRGGVDATGLMDLEAAADCQGSADSAQGGVGAMPIVGVNVATECKSALNGSNFPRTPASQTSAKGMQIMHRGLGAARG